MADIPPPRNSAERTNDQDGRNAALDALGREYALTLQHKQLDKPVSSGSVTDLAGEAAYSFVHDGVQGPIRSLGQIVDGGVKATIGVDSKIADTVTVMPAVVEAPYKSDRWWAQQVGSGLGITLPFMATRWSMKTAGLSLLPRAESAAMASTKLLSASKGMMVADSAMVGFLSDFYLRPVESGEGSQLEARTKHGITGAAVMGTLTASNLGLRHMTGSIARSMVGDSVAQKTARTIYDIGIGSASGAPAGLVSAEANARLMHNRWATSEERSKAVFTMTTMGGALSALHQLPRDNAGFELRAKQLSLGTSNKPEAKPIGLLETSDSKVRASEAVTERVPAKSATEALLDEFKATTIPPEYNAEAKSKTQALIDDQVAFIKTKSIEGQKPVEEVRFDSPQINGISTVLPEMEVTSAKRFANGVYVYENPNGLKGFDGATRLTTDHETFVQTDWSKPHTMTDGFMTGAQVTTKFMRRGHSDIFTNPNGLFGKGSEPVLIAESDAGFNNDSNFSPVRLSPVEGRMEVDPVKYDQTVKTINDKFNNTEVTHEAQRMVERSSDKAEAQKILEDSRRGLDGRALIDFLGKAGVEGKAWLAANGVKIDVLTSAYSPAADASASPLHYVSGKTEAGHLMIKALPETLPDTPILIFGDVTKLSAGEIQALQQHKKPIAIIDPAFERGINVIDLVNGTADAKLKSLVERSKTQGDVVDGPAKEMAIKLNAKLINPKADAPPMTEQGLKAYLEETYPNKDDRMIAANLFANGIDYISMFDYARSVKRLTSEIAAKGEGPLASQKDVYFVQHSGKSSELMNYFAQRLTGLSGDRLISSANAVELVKNPNNKVWLLDDAIYSGDQMSDRASEINFRAHRRHAKVDNIGVGALAAYPKGVNQLKSFNLVTLDRPTPLAVTLEPEFFELPPAEQQRSLPSGGILDGQMQSVSDALAFKRFYHNHATAQQWGGFGSRTSLFYMSPDNSPFFVRDFLNRNLGTPRAFNNENHLSRPFFEKPKT